MDPSHTPAPAGHARRAARHGLALALGQGGAARQPDRAAGVGRPLFPGIVGYEDTVVPAIENAILAGQDIIFLGERGQAKTRMARRSSACWTRGCRSSRGGELNDDPLAPICPAARAIVERDGDATRHRLAPARPPLRREARDARHHHRRPDRRGRPDQGRRGPLPLGRADHPLRAHPAHQPRHLRDQRAARPRRADPGRPAQHPRGARRPDPRLHVRLPLDLFVVATANPEDYTNRGRIITPLKDRLGSQIRTHYPRTLEHEMAIMRQEQHRFAAEDGTRRSSCRPSWRSSSPS